ncbi:MULTISPECIES: TetR/AcrR family transcriptional regulator [Maritimibacter]|jgi:AcrR family transcriptional regulator|uniref:Transcriptional regulator tetR/acrR family protein n=1 Tax=Maritimibacter alkaliphilus HTCC2654 TaxID=314271 RepID=A3VBX1_9RHOB|nr:MULTISPECIES: TetR/AcrR family transcriptional regulator [Maritimibacter]EAQ14454.1 transcriptional regulator tetR/acrR family protein [Rhodobacterales bacterium HTCC2654] [Maritimibacter alkaliphilus HTCC2654]MBL6427173.1 TetR/AcrR family transcriptional regulator [Maritimibacter sp.]TYP82455.1 TetR family transcriptional regulator [Maritimibacter alkaliphilus HTCC2654]
MAVKRRADFAENRVRILEAADEIFVERGVGAPLDSIAQRAGVGRATFFRHFPDRRALINEMLDLFLSKLEETSSKLDVTETSINEITPMFYDQMIHYAPVADFLRAQSREDPVLLEAIDRFHALLRPHVQAAISAGTVREDLREADIVIFAVMLAAAATTPNIGPEGRRAAYDLMMRGLQKQG